MDLAHLNENRDEEKNDGKVFPKELRIKKGPGVGTRVIGSRNIKPQCLVGMSGVKSKVGAIWSRSCRSSVSFLLRSRESCQRASTWGDDFICVWYTLGRWLRMLPGNRRTRKTKMAALAVAW